MGDISRLNRIRYLLTVALDSDEEYLYEGEMSSYARSYAVDAAMELREVWRASDPSPAELAACLKELTRPDRMASGRAHRLLMLLREASRPILNALAQSPEAALRIFALETGKTSLNPHFHDPLYGTIDLNLRLMQDPDEAVRAAAIASAQPTIQHNAGYLKMSIEQGLTNPMLDLLTLIVACENDPSPIVRKQAASVLGQWAEAVGQETFERFLQRGHPPTPQP